MSLSSYWRVAQISGRSVKWYNLLIYKYIPLSLFTLILLSHETERCNNRLIYACACVCEWGGGDFAVYDYFLLIKLFCIWIVIFKLIYIYVCVCICIPFTYNGLLSVITYPFYTGQCLNIRHNPFVYGTT